MTIAVWVVQLLLAALFGMAGFMKTTSPIAQLAQAGISWAPDLPVALVRFIGISEFAGAVGLILPAATGIQPWLTRAAAGGLVLIMLLAMGFHATRGEWGVLPMNLTLGLLALFVVWGRGR
jgi:uncharacterized membrane protein YphA (DoxX/SURF4 family)